MGGLSAGQASDTTGKFSIDHMTLTLANNERNGENMIHYLPLQLLELRLKRAAVNLMYVGIIIMGLEKETETDYFYQKMQKIQTSSKHKVHVEIIHHPSFCPCPFSKQL
jgi:hypothetical protein